MSKKNRREGRLSKVKDDRQPNHLFFFDTETYSKYTPNGSKEQHLRLGVCKYIYMDKSLNITVQRETIFYNTDELMDFIFKYIAVKKAAYIFAHNVGFDLMVTSLPTWFRDKGIEVKPYIRNGMVFIWSVKTDKGTLKFINTGNYTPYKLSDIAKDLGMEKLSVDFDTDDEDELITYCRNDVEIIKQLIVRYIRFLDTNKLGSFKMTLASQALYAYRRRFNTTLPYTHIDESVLDLEEKAYKGGRTDCYHIGEFRDEDYYYVDINSMYPYVMTGDNQPKKRLNTMYAPSEYRVLEMMEHRYVLAEVTLKTPLPYIATLYNPKEYRITNSTQIPTDGKLIFPTGEFKEYLHYYDLEYAIRHGFIQKIHRAVLYSRGDLFTDYVNFFTEMKINATIEGNKTNRLMAKLFLNSLYGKFGQKYKWFEQLENDNDEIPSFDIVFNAKTKKYHQEFKWFGERWGNFTDGWVNHSIPVIAGAITARARMLLWEYMELVGFENLYYTDTDSLIVNEEGYKRLQSYIDPLKLGYLKLEDRSDHLTINGCKDYKFGDKRVLKGVPKSAVEVAPNTWKYEQFEGLGQWQRRGMDNKPLIFTVTKVKRTPYDKGIREADGRITPYNIIPVNF